MKHPNRASCKPAPAAPTAAPDTFFFTLLLLFKIPSWLALLAGLVTFPETPAAAASAQEALFYRLSYMDDRVVNPASGPMENTLVAQLSEVKSPGRCAMACLAEQRCSSFFHDRLTHQCLMHSILFLAADEASPKAGMTYWKISQDHCSVEDGFILYRPLKLCYRYYSQQSFWNESKSICDSAGTPLIKVSSQAISTHLFQFLRGSSTTRVFHVSIGATKGGSGSSSGGGGPAFKWLDGSNVTWFNWASNEPSGGSEENCLSMAWFFYFQWNDIPCGANPIAKYNFICQKIL